MMLSPIFIYTAIFFLFDAEHFAYSHTVNSNKYYDRFEIFKTLLKKKMLKIRDHKLIYCQC